jgi:hypothetical protein
VTLTKFIVMKAKTQLLATIVLMAAMLVSCSTQNTPSVSKQRIPTLLGVAQANLEDALGTSGTPIDVRTLPLFKDLKSDAASGFTGRLYDKGEFLISVIYLKGYSLVVSVSTRGGKRLSSRQLTDLLRYTAGEATWNSESPSLPDVSLQWARSDGIFHAMVQFEKGIFIASPLNTSLAQQQTSH